MYYPIQIPYILNRKFLQNIKYSETIVPELSDYVICFWQMFPKSEEAKEIKNIIVADGCIDLIANFKEKAIGFAGMKHTNFDFTIASPIKYLGARLMPGAFYQITSVPASEAVDKFLPLQLMDKNFDVEHFFSLPLEKAKQVFVDYFRQITHGKPADEYTSLFNRLSQNTPPSVEELCECLGLSIRQCQRMCAKHFGLSPKKILSIIRFQKCLATLTSKTANPSDILSITHFYDQAHFINDFKRNIGITPFELIEKCKH